MLRIIVSLLALVCLPGRAQVSVLTANGNNDRTNSNLAEVQLSPATVTPGTFGKIGAFSVDGQVYAQPLIATDIATPDRGTRNVLYVCTMHNSVYAFDASGVPPNGRLWHVNLGPSVPVSMLFGGYTDIATEVGILGTGAIDPRRGVLYVVSATLKNGAPVYQLHALDLTTGEERLNGPVDISASIAATGFGIQSGTLPFNPRQHLQRPGLLLANDSVYVAFGSHSDEVPWHGWLMSYDARDLRRQIGVFNATPTGNGGAFWQSGRGLAADSRSNLYAISGNGDYDGITNFGQSFLKLGGSPPVRTGSYTPPDWKSMSDNDFDLSAGPLLISGTRIVVCGDKLGNLYVLNADTMTSPGTAPASFTATQSSIFGLAAWSRPEGALLYVQGTREPLVAYRFMGTEIDPTPVATASISLTYSRVGMTLSADGSRGESGIVWQTSGNYNDASAPGALRAFDALGLNELWNSNMNLARDGMPPVSKFASPTVANGRVYVPTFGNSVVIYGLLNEPVNLPPVITFIGSAASYEQDVISPGQVLAIFGTDLGPADPAGMQLDATGAVATILEGTRVLFNGIAGPMAFATSTQVNTIVPFRMRPGPVQVQVEVRGQASDPVQTTATDTSPALFAADSSGEGQALAINQDGTINSADNPAPAGSVLTLYATGLGQFSPAGRDGAVGDQLKTTSAPVTAMLGNQAAQVLYAGTAPGIVEGIAQVNLQIPSDAPADPDLPLVLRVGSRSSPPGITIAVK
jgi:uncharacterized protein (TIGR03437 family)